MNLRLYNTLSRQKEVFLSEQKQIVKMYVCGVTVYDFCHLGHARAYIVWDVVRRYLEFCGYSVIFVQNITDIDDKILHRAQEENIPIAELTDRFITAYNTDMARLNIKPARRYPKATEFINEMIEIIRSLVDQGIAYATDGDVYYSVQQFPGYGKLSHRTLASMQVGASGRVETTEIAKRYPFDFALWKGAKPGEPCWESPWGPGRPGWHIECSAMAKACLGETIDIHTGGADLQFPHHENEIAQSEAYTGKPLARYWLHNGFVNIGGEKMSKSLKNFKTIRSVLEHYDPMAVRLFILQAQYRQPIDFTEDAMNGAMKSWELINEGLLFGQDFGSQLNFPKDDSQEIVDDNYVQTFRSGMDDDFNTPIAISVLFDLAKTLKKERNLITHQGNSHLSTSEIFSLWKTLIYLAAVLGFQKQTIQVSTVRMMIEGDGQIINDKENIVINDYEIQELIEQRKQAKKAKDFKESDRIRDELKEKGIELIDLKGGETTWKNQ